MFNFNITPEQIAAAEAAAQQQQAASVAQQAQSVQQAQETPPRPSDFRGPGGGMLVGPPEINTPEPYNPPPVVAPPTPKQPVPPMFTPEISGPEQTPPPAAAAPSTQQPLPPQPTGPYKDPQDPYYVTDAQNKAEGQNTNVYVSGTGREDENGLSQAARLDILDNANQSLIPEGKEVGFQGNSLIHLMYGGLNPGPKASNPDYQAGQSGDTVGGVGNTDAWGNDINWSKPQTAEGTLGQVIETPAGEYLVVNGAEGNLALMPLKGAKSAAGKYFYNLTSGEHHVGINPQTGEIWYQQAAGYTNWDQTKWTNPAVSGNSNSGGSNNPSSANPNNNPADDGTHPGDDNTPQEETVPNTGSQPQPQPPAPTPPTLTNPYGQSGAFTGTGMGYQQQQTQQPEQQQSQQKVDYVKLLNKMMAQSLFKDMT
jgi:hypothetical protein